MAEDGHRHHTCYGRGSQHHRCSPGETSAASARQHDRGDGETLGNFVQEDGHEDDPSQPVGDDEAGSDGDSVEEGVDEQADQHRIAFVRMHEFVGVCFFSEVEVRRDRVFEEMHEQIAGEEASVYAALVLGTRDYMQKCGFQKATIGLSGGIDSALTAVVASDAVGPENVIGVGMPGPYSSPGSIEDARSLAQNLGIRFELLSINPVYEAYRHTLDDVFAGTKEDVTEENIQSRARGTLLMALSNKFGAIVLSTGNKSELGVGYCTLYGDMVGGLAVISDVPKTLVYRLSEYVNSRRPVIPQATLEKPPSAELRPHQKDSDSLPPYEVLDAVLEDYVEDSHSAERIAADRGLDMEVVQRVIRMVDRAEYKRQQAAPGLKISPKAFGYGRRFPIAAKGEASSASFEVS